MSLPFTGLADIENAFASGQYDILYLEKGSAMQSNAIGGWVSSWLAAGNPAPGSTDSGGTQYVNGGGGSGASANAGGLVFGYDSISPQGRILTSFGATCSIASSFIVADRLCAIGPISVTSTGSKALTTLPALPRYTNGIGVEAWLEVSTAFTTTAPAFYLDSYTGSNNGSGTNAGSGSAITALGATLLVGDMIGPLPLLTPDVGVKGVASFNVSTAAGAGAVNLVLLRRLATFVQIPVTNEANSVNLISQIPCMPIIPDGSTLFVMRQAVNTSLPNELCEFAFAYK